MNIFTKLFKRKSKQLSSPVSIDPVCSMKATDIITSEHNRRLYKFCSDHCKKQFESDPSAYTV